MPTRGEVIEEANHLRRHADRLRQQNAEGFRRSVEMIRARLAKYQMPASEIDEFLPPALLAPPKPCRLRPLADHVVLRPATPKATTEGGLVIPDSAQEVPMRGTVLAVGPGRQEPGIGTVLPAVKVDDEVLFGRYAGVQVTLDGEDVRIMREEDILGILAPEAP